MLTSRSDLSLPTNTLPSSYKRASVHSILVLGTADGCKDRDGSCISMFGIKGESCVSMDGSCWFDTRHSHYRLIPILILSTNGGESWRPGKDVNAHFLTSLRYLLNPYSILSCGGYSTISITNLAVVWAIWMKLRGT